eukprot:tig00000863_g4998.t1
MSLVANSSAGYHLQPSNLRGDTVDTEHYTGGDGFDGFGSSLLDFHSAEEVSDAVANGHLAHRALIQELSMVDIPKAGPTAYSKAAPLQTTLSPKSFQQDEATLFVEEGASEEVFEAHSEVFEESFEVDAVSLL